MNLQITGRSINDEPYMTLADLEHFIRRVKHHGGSLEVEPQVRVSWNGRIRNIWVDTLDISDIVDYSE